MTKRRVSIQGRGAEILFGEPVAPEIEPLSSDLPVEAEATEEESPGGEAAVEEPTPAPTLESDVLLDDEEIARALMEEALAGEPAPKGEEPPVEREPTPPPEEMEPDLEKDLPVEEPPTPVAEIPIVPEEVAMEELDLGPQAAIDKPPPPEVSDAVADVLPPRPAQMFFDTELAAAAADLQEPEEKTLPFELPDRTLTEEQKEQILAWLGESRLLKLEAQIDEAYEDVRRKVGENEDITTDCYNQLLKARDIVLHRDADKIAQAEYYVETVLARLKRASDSESAAKKYQWRILGWGMFWCAFYLAILIMLSQSWFQGVLTPGEGGNAFIDMEVFVSAMIWGGIGGVVAVLYSLFKHVGRRDFDVQYNISYIGKPFLGLILGATIYMVFNLLIRALGILPAGLQGAEGISTPAVAPGVIYLMSWACGFKENRIFDLVDRAIKRLFSGAEAKPPAAPVGPGT